jgi:hypothetical protein
VNNRPPAGRASVYRVLDASWPQSGMRGLPHLYGHDLDQASTRPSGVH